jgi:hypothetical protein
MRQDGRPTGAEKLREESWGWEWEHSAATRAVNVFLSLPPPQFRQGEVCAIGNFESCTPGPGEACHLDSEAVVLRECVVCNQVAGARGRPAEPVTAELQHGSHQGDQDRGDQRQVGFIFLLNPDHQALAVLEPPILEAIV